MNAKVMQNNRGVMEANASKSLAEQQLSEAQLEAANLAEQLSNLQQQHYEFASSRRTLQEQILSLQARRDEMIDDLDKQKQISNKYISQLTLEVENLKTDLSHEREASKKYEEMCEHMKNDKQKLMHLVADLGKSMRDSVVSK